MSVQGAMQLEVVINNQSLSITKDHLVSLNIKRVMGDSANEFTLEAFDETAWQLENALMGSNNAPISIRYSASNNLNKTILFSGCCLGYNMSFVGRATMISITGVLSVSEDISEGWWFEKNSIEWCEQQPENRGTTENPDWWIDGRSMNDLSDYENNEDICAILVPNVDDNGNELGVPIAYFNPSRIFRRIIHTYNGDTFVGLTSSNSYNTNNSGNTNITVDNVSNTVWNCLYNDFGFSKYVTSGIMGNMMQESSMNPESSNTVSGGHYGLCQWSCEYYPSMNGASLTKQLKFIPIWLKNEYNSFKGNYNSNIDYEAFLKLTDEREVALAFSLVMERAGKNESNNARRQDYATAFLNKYSTSNIYKPELKPFNDLVSDSTNPHWVDSGANKFKIGEVDDSRWVQGIRTVQEDETASQYITNVLCKNAVTNNHENYEDESAGFKYFVNASGHHFKALSYDSKITAAQLNVTYGMQNSRVISFSIQNIGTLAMAGTGSKIVDASSLDTYGDLITQGGENILNSNVSKESIDSSLSYQNWYTDRGKIQGVYITSSSTTTSLNSNVSNVWNWLSQCSYTAELTLWGEYSKGYAPGDFLDLIVSGNNGKPHYSSGIYMILEINDSITSQGYIQTLKLFKNSSNTSEYKSTNSGSELGLNALLETSSSFVEILSSTASKLFDKITGFFGSSTGNFTSNGGQGGGGGSTGGR